MTERTTAGKIARNFDALRLAVEERQREHSRTVCLSTTLVLALLDEHAALRQDARRLARLLDGETDADETVTVTGVVGDE